MVTSVISIVSAISISFGTACSDASVLSSEIPVFSVGLISFEISLGTASSVTVSIFSLCSYLGSASSEILDFSLGKASFVTVSVFSLCSYLGSLTSVTLESSLVCAAPGASTASVTMGSIF